MHPVYGSDEMGLMVRDSWLCILPDKVDGNNCCCTAVCLRFYRAMLRRARYCYGKLSVRLSVCLSV